MTTDIHKTKELYVTYDGLLKIFFSVKSKKKLTLL
jgi:hypothetical protein